MAEFRPLPEYELERLSDERLLAYITEARDAGDFEAAKTALGILVFRYWDDLVRRAKIKADDDAEDVAMETVTSAIRSRLEGQSMGEFRAWLNRIFKRRIADYHRKPGLDTTALPEEHLDDDRIWGTAGVVPDPSEEVDVQSVVDQALEKFTEPHHLAVIDRYVFEDLSAQDTADEVNAAFPDLNPAMSVDNVHQIASRFRKELRRLLTEADNPT